MQVYVNGWRRDHGRKMIVNEDLEDCKVTETSSVVHGFGTGALRVERDDAGTFKSLTYSRAISVTVNGDYLFQIKFTPKDIALMAFFCLQDLTMSSITRVFGAMTARKDEIAAARRTLQLGYSSKNAEH